MKRMIKWLVPVLALALIAAACGGDDGDTAAPDTDAAPTTEAATPAPSDDGEAAAPAAPAEEEVTLTQGESGSAAQTVVSGNLLDEIKDRGTLK
ncbi:MAG: hypothetical protein OXE75_01785, partial [bacterium]|nr:hypothetical protein [bacterium]